LSTAATRAEAEAKIAPKRDKLRTEVYECIKTHGPVTDEQIAQITKMNPSTARPRRLELEKAGRIEAAGITKTRSGRRAVAWRVSTPQDHS
jgi:predicted ArsR family transcriptional regulator